MVSLNKLLKTIREVAEGHAQIVSYAEGQRYDISAAEATDYSCLWAVPQGAQVDLAGKSITYKIALVMMDLEKADGSNQIDILSDTALILTDVLAKLRDEGENADEWSLRSATDFEPFVDVFSDQVSGHTTDVYFKTFFAGDICSEIV